MGTDISELDKQANRAIARIGTRKGKTPDEIAAEAKARAEAREAEKAKKQAEREAAAAAKRPHMSKVDRAAEDLPILTEAATRILEEATANLDAGQVTALARHLDHFNRVNATAAAAERGDLKPGDRVRIVGGPNFALIGKEGIVTKAARIRCHVAVDGIAREAYLFTSHVEQVVVEDAAPSAEELGTDEQKTGTEG